MAEQDVSKPKEPPKPVHVGGESLADRIRPYIKQIAIGAIALSVVLGVVFGVRAWKHRGQEQQTAKLAEVMRLAQRPVMLPGAQKDDKDPAFATPADRAKALLAEMDKLGADPPGHAYQASVRLAAGDVDKAIEAYRRCQDAKAEIEGLLCREGLGIALETKAEAETDTAARSKLLEEALAVFQRMQPDEKGPRRVYALYHQGRVLDERKLNRKDEAKAAFEKASELLEAERRHELRDLVQKRLAALGGK